MYRVARALFRAVPSPVKHFLLWSERNPLRAHVHRVRRRLEDGAAHDALYDARYYQRIEPYMASAAAVIADAIVADLPARTVVDVGCGTGTLLAELRRRGVDVFGLDRSDAALAKCREQGIPVLAFDLTGAEPFDRSADVVVSTEVAEHLPEAAADRFVDLLVCTAPRVVLTAAVPGQGGTGHVNEQPQSYWIEKFEARGYRYRQALSARWREGWRAAGVDPAYSSNVMVFEDRSAGSESAVPARLL